MKKLLLNSIRKTKCAVTAEEHNIIGGLGDAIAQVAAKHFPIPIEYVGTKDTFGESGTPDRLVKKIWLGCTRYCCGCRKSHDRKKSS